MAKKIIIFSIIFFIIIVLIGVVFTCGPSYADWNYSWFGTVYFDYAFVKLPNGECIEGAVKAWKDWADSDILQVTFTDGVTYYTHSSNIVLVSTNGK